MFHPRRAAGALLGRLAVRRVRRKGIDLSRIAFIPEPTKMPLQREGVDPVPQLAATRERTRLERLPLPFAFDVWLVPRHEDAKTVLTDRTSYSNDIRHLFQGDGPATSDDIGGLGFTDPPLHTRLRHIVTPELTMRRLARLEPAVDAIVDEAVEAMVASGSPADLVSQLAFPVPFRAICELLGLDYADRREFAGLGSARFDATNGAAAAFGAVSAQREFLFDAVARQRLDPGPGLIGQIIRDEGDAISDVDLAGLADGVFTGGFETTAGMISLGTTVLLRDEKHADLVRTGSREDVDRVVEELLRYLSVVQVAFPRFAKEDMHLFGQRIRRGDVLIPSLTSANRDPRVAGERPEEFDPFRVPRSAHLAFGHGIHRCVGAELARLELRSVFPRLLRRLPDLRLAVPAEDLRFRQLSFVHGLDELPVEF